METETRDRFDGLADFYHRYRPRYPIEPLRALARAAHGVSGPAVALDVGCGTGLSTQALATALGAGWLVVGIEPGRDMRGAARQHLVERSGAAASVAIVAGSADALPIAGGAVSVILVAQALHWFDRPRFYAEAARTLRPDGQLAILYNNRRTDEAPALMALDAFVTAQHPTYRRRYRSFDIGGELRSAAGFGGLDRLSVRWRLTASPDEIAGFFLSRSALKPVMGRWGHGPLRSHLRDIAAAHAHDGVVEVPYDTDLHVVTRQ